MEGRRVREIFSTSTPPPGLPLSSVPLSVPPSIQRQQTTGVPGNQEAYFSIWRTKKLGTVVEVFRPLTRKNFSESGLDCITADGSGREGGRERRREEKGGGDSGNGESFIHTEIHREEIEVWSRRRRRRRRDLLGYKGNKEQRRLTV